VQVLRNPAARKAGRSLARAAYIHLLADFLNNSAALYIKLSAVAGIPAYARASEQTAIKCR
jgi:hypothetical protein